MKHFISLGAGVQSSTMALMAAHGEITPMPNCAIFADTQAEPKVVYEWLDWLENQLPFPVYRVTAGKLSEDEVTIRHSKKNIGNIYRKSKIPAFTLSSDGKHGLLPRKCTTDYKINPILKMYKKLGNIPRLCDTIQITSWIGISTDEASRMKPLMITKKIKNDKIIKPHPYIINRWPLIENNISRAQCLDWMKLNNYPTPPRSACTFCPFHNDIEWSNLQDNSPIEFSEVVQFEKEIQRATRMTNVSTGIPFLHSSCIPLDEVIFKKDEQISNFNNECEGMCGV